MDVSEYGPAQWAAAVLALLMSLFIAGATVRLRKQPLARPQPKLVPTTRHKESFQEDDYPDLQILQDLHLEMAMDPPSGLHCSNPEAPYSFENNFCHGEYLFFHPPTGKRAQGAGGLDYESYFKGKKRLWELRVQLRFKRPPPPDAELFFGIELEDYVPLGMAARRTVSLAVAAMRKAVGNVYQSPGDDPRTRHGELERPTCVLPLWAFDQFLVTPEGEKPPSLTDLRFPELGSKRFKRVAEYAQEIAQLTQSFTTGSTYTLAFWGNSRFLDALNWRLVGIPVVTPLDFDVLAGKPPVYAVLYSRDSDSSNVKDTRHLQSRKNYYFRAAIWSSARRPERSRFEALTAANWSNAEVPIQHRAPTRQAKSSWKRRLSNFLKGNFTTCCMARSDIPRRR